MPSATRDPTIVGPAAVTITEGGTGTSGNEPSQSWIEPLLYPWTLASHTPNMAWDDQELRDWAELSRRARRRWLDENEY